jgi:hypothetical protein
MKTSKVNAESAATRQSFWKGVCSGCAWMLFHREFGRLDVK